MSTLLNNLAFIEHDQAIHRRDGRQTVGNCNHSFALHQFIEALLNRRFHFRIERGSRLIQYQQWRIFEQNARDRNSLTLPAGEFDATFTDLCIVTAVAMRIGQTEDKLMSVGLRRCFQKLLLGGVRISIQNVVANGAVQQ
ncbi:Uncharacterised protein [Vibrio cholerae]|uniref:Uncharacterized protein n=1 Tax=Vibrio cholerae TaxID=666 RepID=A0A655YKV3_VIBCL|nr:Uncharacterised protein [Vibrio cholerae]